MRPATKGFVSLIGSVCTWLAGRLYGDEIFGVLRAVTPSRISDAMLEVLSFGPPIFLLLVGVYFFSKASETAQDVEGKLRFLDVFAQATEHAGVESGTLYVGLVKMGLLLDSLANQPLRIEFVGAVELSGRTSPHRLRSLSGEVRPGIPLAAVFNGVPFDPPVSVRVDDMYRGHLEFRVRYGVGRRLKHTLGPHRLIIGLCVDSRDPKMLRVQWRFDPDHTGRMLSKVA